ncbi:DNA polymerase family B-domain-containing protein [Syncephalis pseudoplumigaleata]|uniref:DNA polymerase n=1 Tax=Syncephalis pseudoplumigaleata TaxID=1712513 RepID=A0A4P9Z096_9FUNG|nr:DNA polymerase family B-domain-containing protein [Syncephalis pseudoplumigaleata]|eukprot:RKP25111.1 DNA polymerase family B-domain-containing protein [Syncephalis pseudoplumigaleata]
MADATTATPFSQNSQNSQWSQETAILEADGSLRMYWLDAYEKNGKVYVFGKVVLDQDDQEVTFDMLYEEVGQVCQQQRISRWAGKEVVRKYAFELRGVPAEATYLKMVYSYAEPLLPAELTGRTFSQVFGTKTTALEHFIMKRKLMGPCWLVIRNPSIESRNLSWCKVEVSISDPKHVEVLRELDAADAVLPPPPLTVMSLSLRVVMNRQKHANEIVMGSALVYPQVNINDPTPVEKLPHEAYSVVRQLDGLPFPMGLGQMLQKQNIRTELAKTERALLNYLITMIYKVDPDIIVGHNFLGFDLDVLLHRMKANHVETWSRLGRLRRTVWPKMQAGAGGMGETTFAERHVMSGRIVCDTYLSAKASGEFVRSKSYSLSQLASGELEIQREDIDFDQVPAYFQSANSLVHLLRHCAFDNYLVISLMSKLQILPLTRQLTTLAGNLWARTMSGARAERNEYLLLHEFHQRKFIVPDKAFKAAANAIDAPDEGTKMMHACMMMVDGIDTAYASLSIEARPKTEGRRKPAYAGGLVLEPKKGFYDKYVLMLDFNSLYPSIIQEFNICFTTVDRPVSILFMDGDQVPEVPDSDLDNGILPRLLATLVDKRRQVKGLMKDAKCTPVEYAQYNIRQMALKLTANSMYGCLGFTHARFYAKSLAMLITSKGREILQNTVELAESKGLDVIYGDTDSIMIYTNTDELKRVKEIGQDLKREVNKRYRLLEIEMDAFYRRMLLLKKKKYAALMTVEQNGELTTTMETKGLDLVRRDWCELSHDVSDFVLKQILSGDGREEILDRIHQYLMTVGRETRGNLVPIDKFVINKGLTKNPHEYADAKSQPHVQVAKRMLAKGISVRTGDTVPFVICEQSAVSTTGTQPATGSYAERAHHPDEVGRAGSNLTIDFEWYLGQQVHPPVARLCAPIEGTDAGRLADCLGLDAHKYRSVAVEATQTRELVTLDSQITDEERFHSVDKFFVRCPYCQKSNLFHGVALTKATPDYAGLQCPNGACQAVLPVGSIGCQLSGAVQKHIRRYQEGWLVCDDPSCQTRTRMLSVRGRRCGQAGCRGMLRLEASSAGMVVSSRLAYLR